MAVSDDKRLAGLLHEALLDDDGFLREMLRTSLQEFLEAEMTEHLGVSSHVRSNERRGYRNGFKPRQLKTRIGTLDLMVPQDREGTFQTELFERYQRSEKALVSALMQMYVEGVSTRKVKAVTEELCGTSFSKSTVSRLVVSLDVELDAWRQRRLEVAIPYLLVDARYEKVRVNGRIQSMGVLVVKGIRADGLREILAVSMADSENETSYDELFSSLKDRGLHGVQLVISDDHKGLVNSVKRNFQGVAWQRCQVHYTRNALGKVARKYHADLAQDLRTVFNSENLEWAKKAVEEVVHGWALSHPDLADWIEETIEDTLACYAFPKAHHKRIRSTNSLERFNQELKRRTRVVRIFPNSASCLRLVTAMSIEQSEEWLSSTKKYLDMSEVNQAARVADSRYAPAGHTSEEIM